MFNMFFDGNGRRLGEASNNVPWRFFNVADGLAIVVFTHPLMNHVNPWLERRWEHWEWLPWRQMKTVYVFDLGLLASF